jgi:hypothetical protein
MPVALKAQSLARIDDDPLDLVVRLIREHLVVAPGTVVFFQRHDASPIRVLFYSLPLPASRFLKGPVEKLAPEQAGQKCPDARQAKF